MMSVVVNKKMEVSGNNASDFRNMAVGEGGYNICLEVCRAADKFSGGDNAVVDQLRLAATQVPMSLSKGASYKPGRQYLRYMREAFINTKQLGTLLMLCHDLNYLSTESYLELNSKVTMFSTKLWKYIKYTERKVRSKTKSKK